MTIITKSGDKKKLIPLAIPRAAVSRIHFFSERRNIEQWKNTTKTIIEHLKICIITQWFYMIQDWVSHTENQ